MSMARYQAASLKRLFEQRSIATMEELKSALGTTVDMTVIRKLRQLEYRTSYSHGSRFYTLDEIAQFDECGLWSCRSVWFSRNGTLMATLEAFVADSEAGWFARELNDCLHVSVKESLLRLVKQGRIAREKIGNRYWYCSTDPETRQRQLLKRQRKADEVAAEDVQVSDEVKAAIVLFMSMLNEKQRRLFAGLESLKLGEDGDNRIAELLQVDRRTVARGRQELQGDDLEPQSVRRSGAGRKPAEKKRRRSSPESES